MGRAAAARKLAAAAAFGGGGLSVMGAGLYGLLRLEAMIARRTIGNADREPPDATGWYGGHRPGPALRIALLGDSSAAGYGVDSVLQTPGAHLASGVAAATDRRVYLQSVAFVGAQTRDLDAQIDQVLPHQPHVVVILVGVNDITHPRWPQESVRLLSAGVRRLRQAGAEVVAGTCPDLGTLEPVAPPLKQVTRAWSRRLAAAQTITVVEAGGRTVSLASVLGAEFEALPQVLFGPDKFHPSAAGYAALASVLLPSVLSALGVAPEDEERLQAHRGEAVLPVSQAAVEAAGRPGTEVGGTEVRGADRGARGRWAQLRRRRRHPGPQVEPPADAEQTEPADA